MNLNLFFLTSNTSTTCHILLGYSSRFRPHKDVMLDKLLCQQAQRFFVVGYHLFYSELFTINEHLTFGLRLVASVVLTTSLFPGSD